MNKKFFVNQSSINDCGAACLAMMLNLFGKKVSLEDIKRKLPLKKDGVSAYDIIKLSSEYGVSAEGYKNCKLENLKLPLIAHVINENGLQHFVVLLKILKNKVLIADPASNIFFISMGEFKKHYTGIVILFKEKLSKSSFHKEKVLAVKTVILTIILAIITVLSSYLLTNVLKGFDNKDVSNTLLILLIFFAFSILKEIINFLRQRLALLFELSVDKKITIHTIKKLINLPRSFYYQNGSGELISKINDLSHVKQMIYTSVESLSISVILIISILVFLLVVNRQLFIINLVIILFFFIINKMFFKKHFYNSYTLQVKNEMLNGKISDCVSGILTIKNLSKEDYFNNDLESSYLELLKEDKDLAKVYQTKNLMSSILTLVFNLVVILSLLFKKAEVYQAIFIISIEDVVMNAINELCRVQLLYANFKSALMRLKSLHAKEEITCDNFVSVKKISFKNLNFKRNNVPILNNVNLNVSLGEWVMIKGKTGSGKSTLFKLLTKQIPYDENGIYINDKNLNNYLKEEIKMNITYVDQKAKLFNKSIEENIYLGNKVEDKRIDAYLKMNGIDKNIIVDNANSNISGGQMQKIIIAQTLANCGNVIIFDETTSQIDMEDENKILRFIKKEYQDKTIILISHRNSNSHLFDKVVNIINGTVKIINKGDKNEVNKN